MQYRHLDAEAKRPRVSSDSKASLFPEARTQTDRPRPKNHSLATSQKNTEVEASYRGKCLVYHSLHRHVSYALQFVVDDELRDELGLESVSVKVLIALRTKTYETEHVDEGRQCRDYERVPSSMRLIKEGIDGINRQTRYREVRHDPEGQLVIPIRSNVRSSFYAHK